MVSWIAILAAACDPNVVIGARWNVTEGGFSGSGGGSAPVMGGASGAGDDGTPSAGAGGAPLVAAEWCATAPWLDTPVRFVSQGGDDDALPPGSYLITYVSGAQIHDLDIGYEVTDWYYAKNSLHAGHHVFSGDSPETGATTLWLDENGIVGSGGTIPEVEAANRGHTWPLEHQGGELYVTLYDDDYGDNVGPGTRFCITAAMP